MIDPKTFTVMGVEVPVALTTDTGHGRLLSQEEARDFVAQCFRLRHVHPRWRQWLRMAMKDAR